MRRKGRFKVRRITNIFMFATIIVTFVAAFEVFNFVLQVNAKQVVLADNNLKLTYDASQKSVEAFLKANDIVLGEKDRLNVELDESLKDGMFIEIKRAIKINATINEEKMQILTSAQTVGDALKEIGISILPTDDINHTQDTKIFEGMYIEYRGYTIEEVVLTENIDYGTTYQDTSTLNKGVTETVSEGEEGTKEVTYSIKYYLGEEVEKTVVSENIIKQPVNKVVKRGTLEVYNAPNGKQYKVKQIITMRATAYTDSIWDTGKTPDHPQYGITRSGLKTRVGIVAVDPSVIPLLTNLYVEGYGEAIAADTGSAIKGNKIDLYMNTREEALQYGVKSIKVYVLEE